MKILDAHGRLEARTDRSVLPFAVMLESNDGTTSVDAWPAYAMALASMSGALDDASTEADLDEAIKHGFTLLEAGIIEADAVDVEFHHVLETLMEWGMAMEANEGSLAACSDG